MKTVLSTISICFALLAAVCLLLLQNHLRQTDQLRNASRLLERELQTAKLNLQELSQEKAKLTRELTEREAEVDHLQLALTAKAAAQARASDRPLPSPPKLKRVRTFLGTDFLGEGWLIPARPGPNRGGERTNLPPAVVLPESLRKNLTVYETNIVEREVFRQSTVNYNYTPARTYSYPVFYPVWNPRPKPPESPRPVPSLPRWPVAPAQPRTTPGSPWGSIPIR